MEILTYKHYKPVKTALTEAGFVVEEVTKERTKTVFTISRNKQENIVKERQGKK